MKSIGIVILFSIGLLHVFLGHAQDNGAKGKSHKEQEDMFKKKVVHVPVADGDCLACHESPAGGKKLNQTSVNLVCLECHSDLNEGNPNDVIHEPFNEDCTSCHNPHASDNVKLLISPKKKLCFECHGDVEDVMTHSSLHKALVDNDCIHCHAPHRSAHKHLLVKPVNELCLSCHSLEKIDFKEK